MTQKIFGQNTGASVKTVTSNHSNQKTIVIDLTKATDEVLFF
jgi:hypothetical protein